MLHILSLSQREAEMQSETYQPLNKRPNEEQKKKKRKKELLVIAEICCPQEIKNMNNLIHAISTSFVSM